MQSLFLYIKLKLYRSRWLFFDELWGFFRK